MAKKEEVKKSIWKECWEEYVAFVTESWKQSWTVLKEAVLTFLEAIFDWLLLIVGAVFGGLWNLIILPVGKWLKEKIIEWIKRI